MLNLNWILTSHIKYQHATRLRRCYMGMRVKSLHTKKEKTKNGERNIVLNR